MHGLVLGVLIALGGWQGGAAVPAPHPGYGWPLAGAPRVERGFEPPRTAYGPGHRRVDLRAALGQQVLAAAAGRVSYAGLLAGRGVVVVVHSGGLRTTYEPVRAVVRVGQAVVRGTPIGVLTEGHPSCRAGTTCLHWGLLRGSVYLDPLSLVLGRDLRLLPLGDVVLRGTGPPLRAPFRPRALGSPHGVVSAGPRPPAVRRPPAAAVAAVALALGVGAAVGPLLGQRGRRRQDAARSTSVEPRDRGS